MMLAKKDVITETQELGVRRKKKDHKNAQHLLSANQTLCQMYDTCNLIFTLTLEDGHFSTNFLNKATG